MNNQELEKPFVGLRPFEESESLLFFGRDEQLKTLLKRLHKSKFVAVVGSSGSGKSSLIKAGLIPKLKAGFLNQKDHWDIVSLRPGSSPIVSMASSLLQTFELDKSIDEISHGILTEGAERIIELIKPKFDRDNSSLLLLVDQFEEIFTYDKESKEQRNNYSSKIAKIEFVNTLIELIEIDFPIYVIITMRSDFIGRCNEFHELPKLLSESQFLVPRLSHQQLKETIAGPIKLFGGELASGLTTKILNDLKEGDDQLPILEHGLSRLWMEKGSDSLITLDHYKQTGKLGSLLSKHANDIYEKLVKDQPKLGIICAEMFKYLIKPDGANNEGVRQPRPVAEIIKITGGSLGEIQRIYDAFSIEGASFLYSASGKELEESSEIDISHESLIREWDQFKQWKLDEDDDRKQLVRLWSYYEDYVRDDKNYLPKSATISYINWHKAVAYKNKKTKESVDFWAERYEIDFQKIFDFLLKSKRYHTRLRRIFIGLGIGVFVSIFSLLLFTIYQSRETIAANEAKVMAQEAEAEAQQQQLLAEQARIDALKIAAKNKEDLLRAAEANDTTEFVKQINDKIKENYSLQAKYNSQAFLYNRTKSELKNLQAVSDSSTLFMANKVTELEKMNDSIRLQKVKSENDLSQQLKVLKDSFSTVNYQLSSQLGLLKAISKSQYQNAKKSFDSLVVRNFNSIVNYGTDKVQDQWIIKVSEGNKKQIVKDYLNFTQSYFEYENGSLELFIIKDLTKDNFYNVVMYDPKTRESSTYQKTKKAEFKLAPQLKFQLSGEIIFYKRNLTQEQQITERGNELTEGYIWIADIFEKDGTNVFAIEYEDGTQINTLRELSFNRSYLLKYDKSVVNLRKEPPVLKDYEQQSIAEIPIIDKIDTNHKIQILSLLYPYPTNSNRVQIWAKVAVDFN